MIRGNDQEVARTVTRGGTGPEFEHVQVRRETGKQSGRGRRRYRQDVSGERKGHVEAERLGRKAIERSMALA